MATVIRMPQASQTMDEGVIVKWRKKTGDTVRKGDVVADIETDKAVIELQSDSDGVLRKIMAEEGSEVPVLKPIAVIGDEDEKIDLKELLSSQE